MKTDDEDVSSFNFTVDGSSMNGSTRNVNSMGATMAKTWDMLWSFLGMPGLVRFFYCIFHDFNGNQSWGVRDIIGADSRVAKFLSILVKSRKVREAWVDLGN